MRNSENQNLKTYKPIKMQNIIDYLLLNGFVHLPYLFRSAKPSRMFLKDDHVVLIARGEIKCYRKDGDTYRRYLTYETMDMEHADVMFFFHAIGVVPLKTVVHKVRGLKDIKDIKAFSHLN